MYRHYVLAVSMRYKTNLFETKLYALNLKIIFQFSKLLTKNDYQRIISNISTFWTFIRDRNWCNYKTLIWSLYTSLWQKTMERFRRYTIEILIIFTRTFSLASDQYEDCMEHFHGHMVKFIPGSKTPPHQLKPFKRYLK